MRSLRPLLLALVLVIAAITPVRAADSLEAARELYAGAAYDEALAMLQRLQSSPDKPPPAELQQERALCLLALNRLVEAEAAIAVVVKAQPLYVPDETIASPRVRAAFQDVRARMAPEIARLRFVEGRESFLRRDYEQATASFDVVLELARQFDAAAQQDEVLSDMQMLAEGFRTLSEASLAAAEQVPPEAPAPSPPAQEESLAVGRLFDQSIPGVTPPVVVKQNVPEWRSFMGAPPGVAGMMAVTIDEQGRVEQADIIRSLHSAYDRLLLAAAAEWTYVPATHDGRPVKFRKTIRLALR